MDPMQELGLHVYFMGHKEFTVDKILYFLKFLRMQYKMQTVISVCATAIAVLLVCCKFMALSTWVACLPLLQSPEIMATMHSCGASKLQVFDVYCEWRVSMYMTCVSVYS